MSDETVTIIIGGDFVPTNSNSHFFKKVDVDALIGQKCRDLLSKCDLRIINLETPLSDDIAPIVKWGPNLVAPTYSVELIKKMGIDLACISNNHIMDQGVCGLESTMKALDSCNIKYVGAGLNREDSSKVITFYTKGKKISFFACCENEFSTLGNDGKGANPFDVFLTFDQINKAKENCDVLIVLFHGGIEQYRYPTPRMRKIAHKAIESGADCFICQHSHCIGSYEEYEDKTIVYGQGNFLFDAEDNEFWNNSLLIKLSINQKIKTEYIPIVKRGCSICIAEDNECKNILKLFMQRSDDIRNPGFVEEKFNEYAKENIYKYLKLFGGRLSGSVLYRGIDKMTHNSLSKKIYGEKQVACILDYMRCESLNDFIVAGCSEIVENAGDL